MALDFIVIGVVVVVIVHVMIGRRFFVIVVDAIGRRGSVRGRASGPYIVVIVVDMGRIILKVDVVVGEHRHELFVVEPVEVLVFDVDMACDGWSFKERDGIADRTTVVAAARG